MGWINYEIKLNGIEIEIRSKWVKWNFLCYVLVFLINEKVWKVGGKMN